MKLAWIKKNIFTFSLTLGVISAIILTLIIVVWELIENPGGIYHNQSSINWSFVYDLAISWFVPTFINVTVYSAIIYIISSVYKRLKKNRN